MAELRPSPTDGWQPKQRTEAAGGHVPERVVDCSDGDLVRIPGSKAAGYFVPPSFRSKRSRPIRVTTVISSNDVGQTGEAALTRRRCLAATFSLMIDRRHCSTNSR